ncbi:MAG: hypothetical protein OEZ36_00735 [Spirochaetota bacterium]|nr:hypothetical protein [Spirochaetota bacterium]
MRSPLLKSIFLVSLILFSITLSSAARMDYSTAKTYQKAINLTKQMVRNSRARKLASKFGLNIMNITWEDTGRYKNSAVGPNISDMTIQVGFEEPKTQRFLIHTMPVIRFPNYSDKTADIDPREFTLLVGNEKGKSLKRISLYDFLENPKKYLSKPGSWTGKRQTLLAKRDTKVLVSAQACFLPVPKKGKATFNPVLFNYQSRKGDPAVLTILATRQGTSVTVIDNVRDAYKTGSLWGQRLFFNKNGQRASLTGQRLSDFKTTTEYKTATKGKNRPDVGLNMVLLIQVPLKQKKPMRISNSSFPNDSSDGFIFSLKRSKAKPKSNVEAAVIGHGKVEGPFTEMDNLDIERDSRFPIRVTVQFYKATSNGVVSYNDMAAIKGDIDKVYAKGSVVGSLVVGGDTGRVTEYEGVKVQPANWWESFWQNYEQNTGINRQVAISRLKELLGQNYRHKPVSELYIRTILR